MWLDRPPLCAGAQKAVRNTIDDTLKSYILICVRWYSLINILSRAHRTQDPSLSLCLGFASFSANNRIQFRCECVSMWLSASCAFAHLRVSAKRETDSERQRQKWTELICEIDSPGICACLVDSLHSSDSSDCTWERTLGRIWKRAQNKSETFRLLYL